MLKSSETQARNHAKVESLIVYNKSGFVEASD